MNAQNHHTLINPQNGNLAFKVNAFDSGTFDHIQRFNYYSIVWLKEGAALLRSDFNQYQIEGGTMMFFTPYQPFMVKSDAEIRGVALNFHPDFFCIYHHDKEVSCNGILFNNIYKPPYIKVEKEEAAAFEHLLEQIKAKMQQADLSQYELLVSYLKIFMIKAVRIKSNQNPELAKETKDLKEPFVLQELMEYIEYHFNKEHQPGYYASLLNITPKALGRITKQHFNKTLTDLIAERIIIEAKRELYLTSKPVKAIAYDLGFDDEFYFSRYFKNHTAVSPQLYRDTVGAGVAEMM
jgi:AraC family transcriptional regulator, transcriptional activator of pobA